MSRRERERAQSNWIAVQRVHRLLDEEEVAEQRLHRVDVALAESVARARVSEKDR